MLFGSGGPGDEAASALPLAEFDKEQAISWISEARITAGPTGSYTIMDISATSGGVCDCAEVSSRLEKRYNEAFASGRTKFLGVLRHIEFGSLSHDFFVLPKVEDPGPDASEEEKQLYARSKFAVYTGAPQIILDGTAAQYTGFLEKAAEMSRSDRSKKLITLHDLEVAELESCVRDGVFTAAEHQAFIGLVKSNMGLFPKPGQGNPFGSSGGKF